MSVSRNGFPDGDERLKAFFSYCKVPMQTNNVDCGVYLLHFVEKFFSDQASFEEILSEQKSRRGMWDEQLVREKRAALVSLFARVYHDYRAAGKP